MSEYISHEGRIFSVNQFMVEVRNARREYQRAKELGTEQEQNIAYGRLYTLEKVCANNGLNMG